MLFFLLWKNFDASKRIFTYWPRLRCIRQVGCTTHQLITAIHHLIMIDIILDYQWTRLLLDHSRKILSLKPPLPFSLHHCLASDQPPLPSSMWSPSFMPVPPHLLHPMTSSTFGEREAVRPWRRPEKPWASHPRGRVLPSLFTLIMMTGEVTGGGRGNGQGVVARRVVLREKSVMVVEKMKMRKS